MCVYIYIHVYICTYVDISLSLSLSLYIYIYIYVSMCIHIYIYNTRPAPPQLAHSTRYRLRSIIVCVVVAVETIHRPTHQMTVALCLGLHLSMKCPPLHLKLDWLLMLWTCNVGLVQ